MEQIKLGNGNLYDLAINGIIEEGNEKLRIVIPAGAWNFSEIESSFDLEVNTQRIEILDVFGETMDIKKGYTYLESMKKQKDYVTGRIEHIPETEEGEITYEDIIGVVYIISLSKPDLRKQVEILQETVDTLVLDSLGA